MSICVVPDATDRTDVKRVKVEKACQHCRSRKRRCAAAWPCAQCVADGVPCDFSLQAPSVKTTVLDRALEQIIQQMHSCTKKIDAQTQRLDDLSTRLQRLERGRESLPAANKDYFSPGLPHTMPEDDPVLHDAVESRSTVPITFARALSRLSDDMARHTALAGENHLNTFRKGTRPPRIPASHSRVGREISPSVPAAASDYGMDWQTISVNRRVLCCLFRGYVKNMHVLHPIVDLKFLESLLDRLHVDDAQAIVHTSSPGGSKQRPSGRKRKRNDMFDVAHSHMTDDEASRDESFCRPEHALICMVLALGAVCLKQEISQRPRAQMLFSGRAEDVSSHYESLGKHHTSSGTESSTNDGKGSQARATLLDCLEHPSSRNYSVSDSTLERFLDAVGRKYIAEAEPMLENELHGTELIHAQLFILCGLYESQEGGVLNSVEWSCAAGQVAKKLLEQCNLLHPCDSASANLTESYAKLQRLVRTSEHDFIVLVAWSCIQLEGDVAADVSIRTSGLRTLESRIPWPYRIPGSEAYQWCLSQEFSGSRTAITGYKVLVFFTSQIWLRKWLSSAQAQLDGNDRANRADEQLYDILREQQSTLDCWRVCLPEELRWSDLDPAPVDMLTARLRATYWTVQYTINQLCLDQLLHSKPLEEKDRVAPNKYPFLSSLSEVGRALRPSTAGTTLPETCLAQCRKRFIQAALEKTTAFDGIPHPLISTNIDRIVHEQMESTLVLIVSSLTHPELVKTMDLTSLLERTIAFLIEHAPESQFGTIDFPILQELLSAIQSMARQSLMPESRRCLTLAVRRLALSALQKIPRSLSREDENLGQQNQKENALPSFLSSARTWIN